MPGQESTSSRGSRGFAVIVLAFALVATLTILSDQAEALSCSGAGKWHTGQYHEPSSGEIYGAWVEINTRQAELCTGAFTASAAWSMIQRDGGNGWMQVGYTKESGDGRRWFVQTSKDAQTATTDYFTGIVLDSKWGYKVRIESDGYGHLYRCDVGTSNSNCVHYKTTGWKPFNLWTGTRASFSGETFHTATDMPGVTSLRTNFSEIREIKGSGGWYSGALTPSLTGCTCYQLNPVDATHFRIYTER